MTGFTLHDEIAQIIRRETRFLRHYWAEVIDDQDPVGKGRVKVTIPMLGWSTPAEGAWCMPRMLHSMITPKVGEYVEVYFLEGDENKPVWLGQAHEITGQTPENFSPEKAVVYKSPKGDGSIVYEEKEAMKIDGEEIHLNGDSRRLVTFAQLDSALQTFISSLNGHSHASHGAPPTVPMSLNINASETQTIKTGG